MKPSLELRALLLLLLLPLQRESLSLAQWLSLL
jgi:hypothetical protein